MKHDDFLVLRLFFLAILYLALIKLLSGCVGLPTVTVTPASTRLVAVTTSPVSDVSPTATRPEGLPFVQITGNVNLRDGDGVAIGWLARGKAVQAKCEGQWCYLSDNSKFWRGCSDNNPERLGCEAMK